MIKRIFDKENANYCDDLLTKLIDDEKQYDNFVESIIVNNYFEKIILDDKNILLGYFIEDKIVGYIFLKPIINNNKKGYIIDGLYVLENFRNKKIGKSLINEALNIISNLDASFIDLNVLFKNDIAIKLYKSLGFNELKINMRKNL